MQVSYVERNRTLIYIFANFELIGDDIVKTTQGMYSYNHDLYPTYSRAKLTLFSGYQCR